MSEYFPDQPSTSINPIRLARPLYAAGREPEPITALPEVETPVAPSDFSNSDQPSGILPFGPEAERVSEVASYEPDPAEFSLRALKKYANPVTAAKSYAGWVKRTVKTYGWAEVNGTVTALGSAYTANRLGFSPWATAWAGSLGENVGFHGTNVTKKFRALRSLENDPHNRREAAWGTLRYLIGGFAVAEVVDTPARSYLMHAPQRVTEFLPFGLGSIVAAGAGKFAADNVYYGIVDPMLKRHNKKAEQRRIQRKAKVDDN